MANGQNPANATTPNPAPQPPATAQAIEGDLPDSNEPGTSQIAQNFLPIPERPEPYIFPNGLSEPHRWARDSNRLEAMRSYQGTAPAPWAPQIHEARDVVRRNGLFFAQNGSRPTALRAARMLAFNDKYWKDYLSAKHTLATMDHQKYVDEAEQLTENNRQEFALFADAFTIYGEDEAKLKQKITELTYKFDDPSLRDALQMGGVAAVKRAISDRVNHNEAQLHLAQQRANVEKAERAATSREEEIKRLLTPVAPTTPANQPPDIDPITGARADPPAEPVAPTPPTPPNTMRAPIDDQVDLYLNGFPRNEVTRGWKTGSAEFAAFEQRVAQRMREEGITPRDLAERQAAHKHVPSAGPGYTQAQMIEALQRLEGLSPQTSRSKEWSEGVGNALAAIGQSRGWSPEETAKRVAAARTRQPARQSAMRYWLGGGPGGIGTQRLDVAAQHMQVLEQLAGNLHNQSSPAWNAAANAFKVQFGYDAPTSFDAVKSLIGGEVASAAIGGIGALRDRDAIRETINRANSPDQFAGSIEAFKKILLGQIAGRRQLYKVQTGRDDFDELLEPGTLEYLQSGRPAAIGTTPTPGPAAPSDRTAPPVSPSGPIAAPPGAKEGETLYFRGHPYRIEGGQAVPQ